MDITGIKLTVTRRHRNGLIGLAYEYHGSFISFSTITRIQLMIGIVHVYLRIIWPCKGNIPIFRLEPLCRIMGILDPDLPFVFEAEEEDIKIAFFLSFGSVSHRCVSVAGKIIDHGTFAVFIKRSPVFILTARN